MRRMDGVDGLRKTGPVDQHVRVHQAQGAFQHEGDNPSLTSQVFVPYTGTNCMADHLGSFDLLVLLALLRLEEEQAYGVTISAEIEQTTGRAVALATVYATLERLEDRGLVSSRLGESTAQRGGRAKRHFRVTTNGVRQVRETKGALVKMWRGIGQLQEG
jgi:PadR family transcriptional regulator, regulatory protein PadR